jgi:hypothetical protein
VNSSRSFQLKVNVLEYIQIQLCTNTQQQTEQDVDIFTKEHEIWSECALKKLELQRATQMGGEYWVEPYLFYVEGLWQVVHNEAL